MNRKQLFLLLLLALALAHTRVHAQKRTRDAQLWSALQIRKDIAKDLRLDIEQGWRIAQNISRTDEIYTQAALEFDFARWFEMSISYRFSQERFRENGLEYGHRFCLDFQFEKDIKRWEFAYRQRLQTRYGALQSSPDGKIPKNYTRHRLGAGYNIKNLKLTPEIETEAFVRLNLNQPRLPETLRLTCNLTYKVSKKNDLKLFYRIDKEINQSAPENQYIIGIEWIFELP